MSEPSEIQFDCIGCGTKNPANAEVCSGCGHRFAGPSGESIRQPLMASVSRPVEQVFESGPVDRPANQPTAMGCLLKGIAITATVLATLIAFAVAFLATCSALWNQDTGIAWSFAAGLAAASAVVVVALGIGRLIHARRRDHDKINWRG